MSRPTWDEYGLTLAKAAATRSACSRRQAGAVILDIDHKVVSMGYNGAPSGMTECSEGGCPRARSSVDPGSDYDSGPGFCVARHAEMNAVAAAGRQVVGMTMYVTHQPCNRCAKDLAHDGIRMVVWPGGTMVPREWLGRMVA